ncbi:transglutaminase-like domain-containing protein [Paenibacillus sp. alder61]|uniref:Transglutaminase domain-containing protein n=1 Tax=Paenibacillus faecis TaxID=862114 RepID=A0A5D0CRV9_9BACL|nr:MULTISPECIES: transglutaminase-like domain-containing protein [Paenibacillus]MCA1293609.1 transglutaminase-like domain-containing protein [Paenibacillus sp. alder61]TYA12726.1 transglutaminase domain-containing protein [Paenibacillus faecis]
MHGLAWRKLGFVILCCWILAGCQWADRMAEDLVRETAAILQPIKEKANAPETKPEQSTQETRPEPKRNADSEAAPITGNLTVADLKNKYSSAHAEIRGPASLARVEPDEHFYITFKTFFGEELRPEDIVSVHTDPKVLPESRVDYRAEFAEEANSGSRVVLSPSLYGVLTSNYTYRAGENMWGNAPKYYIRINYDMNSAKPVHLDSPIVVPFTVKSALPAPKVAAQIDGEGRLKLTWNPVEGAEVYHIYNDMAGLAGEGKKQLPKTGAEEGFKDNYPILIGVTTHTEFDDFMMDGKGGLSYFSSRDRVSSQNLMVSGNYYVTAVRGKSESNFSETVQTYPLLEKLPSRLTKEASNRLLGFRSLDDLPEKVDVENVDGSVTSRRIVYDTARLSSPDEGEASDRLYYRVLGTALRGWLSFYDRPTDREIRMLESRQESVPEAELEAFLLDDETSSEPQIEVKTWKERFPEENKGTTERKRWDRQLVPDPPILKQVNIHADSALEEYLARFMIDGQRKIPLRAFPEAEDEDQLFDALNKVYYQNPMILGVKSYRYSYFSESLIVNYHDSQRTIKEKQAETLKAARLILSSMIKEGMTDEDKRLAIYDYLNDNAVYDDEAYKNSKAHDFEYVDDQFSDAYTPYGVLVKQKGVCMSYAYAFKLLGDLAGLESIVVTGTLDDIPHAWNKVRIGEDWLNVDATNGATNAGVPYFLYNASDQLAEKLKFHFDEDYVLDSELSDYAGKSNSRDYYVSHGLEAKTLAEFKKKLAAGLQRGDEVISLRVASNLDEDDLMEAASDTFYQISPELAESADYYEMENYVVIYP